jgi:hypothetical protein
MAVPPPPPDHAGMVTTLSIRRAIAILARVVTAAVRGVARPFRAVVRRRPRERLLKCGACGAWWICPMERRPLGDGHCRIRVRCAACAMWREIVVSEARAAALSSACDEHTATMERAVAELDRERMMAEVDTFVTELHDGRIDASMFAA